MLSESLEVCPAWAARQRAPVAAARFANVSHTDLASLPAVFQAVLARLGARPRGGPGRRGGQG